MKRTATILLALALLVEASLLMPAWSTSAGASTEEASADQRVLAAQEADAAAGAGETFVGGEVLVTFKDGTSASKATDTLNSSDVVQDTTVSQEALDQPVAVVDARVEPTSSVANAISELQDDPNVESVQPNYLYYPAEDGDEAASTLASDVSELSGIALTTQAAVSTNDPALGAGRLWELGTSSSGGVDAETAWSTTRCNKSVSIAIIDTGALQSHQDLAGNIVDYYVASGAVSSIQNTHGTHVAGIASACTNNGIGVAGVSYNAGLVICKADHLTSGGLDVLSEAQLVDSYNHVMSVAKSKNVRVVNLSIETAFSSSSSPASWNTALTRAISTAYNTYGIVTVCAAGNSNIATPPYVEYPGDYPTCVSVMNTTSQNVRYAGSNYNLSGTRSKNISAPGTTIYSTTSTSTSSYNYSTGTSMASPVVAGILALEFAEDPSLTASQAKAILYTSATDLGTSGWDEAYGYGKASASGAVGAIIGTADVQAYDAAYTGSAITGNVVVTTDTGRLLKEGTDYTVSYSNNVEVGTATVTVTGRGAGSYSCDGNTASGSGYVGSVTTTFSIKDAVAASDAPMYRLYNPNSGEHFFTSSSSERDGLVKVGWHYEGVAWTAPSASSTLVYRLYNKNGGEHHYTTSASEASGLVSAGWSYEGVGWYSADSKATPLYRLYNPNAFANNHHYTTNTSERDWLVSLGWRYEGIGWYGV